MIIADALRYAAFTTATEGGNPAGVVLEAASLDDSQMQAIAAEIGYSETAFLTHAAEDRVRVRYFAPEGEVDFCGHATIATAAALAERHGSGSYLFDTNIGRVDVHGDLDVGAATGSFVISHVSRRPFGGDDLDLLLGLLGWTREDLHPDYPPAIGYSGNLHPILVAEDRTRLAALDYDYIALQELSRQRDWITLQLVAPTGPGRWRARNPFPWGGVYEDPATGSAAAAFLGYLRGAGRIAEDESLTIDQGVEMGRPSTLTATSTATGARISGPAVRI